MTLIAAGGPSSELLEARRAHVRSERIRVLAVVVVTVLAMIAAVAAAIRGLPHV